MTPRVQRPRSDVLGQVFDTFYTTKEQGTRLGLSVVRTIIEIYDGKIWAENLNTFRIANNRGSTGRWRTLSSGRQRRCTLALIQTRIVSIRPALVKAPLDPRLSISRLVAYLGIGPTARSSQRRTLVSVRGRTWWGMLYRFHRPPTRRTSLSGQNWH
jgi:hypothetical protein